MEKKKTLYNYLLPRSKRKLNLYVQAILGIPAFLLFILSAYLAIFEPWYLLLSLMGLLFSLKLINILWSYFRYENLTLCLVIDQQAIGVGFEYDKPQFWIFMDGVYVIELEEDDWWVIRHSNGTWIYFPNNLLSEEDIIFLRNKIKFKDLK